MKVVTSGAGLEQTGPAACGHRSYDDWLTPCELVKGHLCMHASKNAFGPQRRKCWWNYGQARHLADDIAYGILQPVVGLAPLEASWPWAS